MKYELHIDDNGALSHITRDGVHLTRADELETHTIFDAIKAHIEWMNVHNSNPDVFEAYHQSKFSEWMDKPRQTYIAVVGSREWCDKEMVFDKLSIWIDKSTIVISGGARGVDTFAIEHAKMLGAKTVVMPAQWDRYGKKAGMIRNGEMLSAVTHVIAFWDGHSVGTKNMIDRAVKAKHVTTVIVYSPDGKRTILKDTDSR